MSETFSQSSPRTASDVTKVARFLDALFPHPREHAMQLWEGTHLPASRGAPRFTLAFNSPGTVRQVFSPPVELNAGEAYVRGDFDILGDIFPAFELLERVSAGVRANEGAAALFRHWLSLPKDGEADRRTTHDRAQLTGARHSKARDKAAIQHHYDVGNAFYALFLDPRMVYSCAYFPSGTEDLAAAQERKLDMICRKLRLRPGERLLDIGCGWGGLVMYAAQHYDIQALGVTLSAQQHALANERIQAAGLGGRVTVNLLDYRDLTDASFDKLASVGMFEHVGRDHLPEYFAHTHRLLKPGGVFLNHGISVGNVQTRRRQPIAARLVDRLVMGLDSSATRHIFPDGELTPVSVVNMLAEEAGFEVRDTENWREHYALTLRHWVNRLERNKNMAVQLSGESLYRTWRLYMAGSVNLFESGRQTINQTLLAKPLAGRSGLPWSRADWYAGEPSKQAV